MSLSDQEMFWQRLLGQQSACCGVFVLQVALKCAKCFWQWILLREREGMRACLRTCAFARRIGLSRRILKAERGEEISCGRRLFASEESLSWVSFSSQDLHSERQLADAASENKEKQKPGPMTLASRFPKRSICKDDCIRWDCGHRRGSETGE